MKIVVTFESIEEFDAFRGAPTIWREVPAPAEEKEAEPVKEEKKAEPVKEEPEVPFKEDPMPAPMPAPEPEKKEESTAPQYKLTDMQKAVREVLKAKGKEAAKAVLANFQDKDKPDKPAGGASALRPEDYEAAFNALQEALNG